jgi:hypothetical protein
MSTAVVAITETCKPVVADKHPRRQTMQCMEVRGGNEPVDTALAMPGVEAWVYSRPYRTAGERDVDATTGGGDVHYISSCATGRVTRMLVADVSGHGTAVCDAAGSLRALMRRFVNYIDQTQFIRAMNRRFVTMSADHCFATAVVTTFFAPTRTLAVCNAGHPPPLWYRATRGQWEYLELRRATKLPPSGPAGSAPAKAPAISNIPLGIFDVTRYQQFEVTLDPGDLVLCYTDSLIESLDAKGELLGQDGLIRIARSLDAGDPSTLIPTLLAAVRAAHEGNLDDDDVTALLSRPTGAGGAGPLGRRLMSPVRVARGVLASWLGWSKGPAPLPEFSLVTIGGAWVSWLNRFRRPTRARRT